MSPYVSTLSPPSRSLGMVILSKENLVKGAPLRVVLQGARWGALELPLDSLPVTNQAPRALDLSTRYRVSSHSPWKPTANPFFTDYSHPLKYFLPYFPSTNLWNMCLTCFLSFTLVTFSLVRIIGHYWYLQSNSEIFCFSLHQFSYLICPKSLFVF